MFCVFFICCCPEKEKASNCVCMGGRRFLWHVSHELGKTNLVLRKTWESYRVETIVRHEGYLVPFKAFYPIEILHRKVAEHQVELPWLESKETCRNSWMKMWALSSSCSHAFAPPSWTQALWNHKPSYKLLLINYALVVVSYQSNRKVTKTASIFKIVVKYINATCSTQMKLLTCICF